MVSEERYGLVYWEEGEGGVELPHRRGDVPLGVVGNSSAFPSGPSMVKAVVICVEALDRRIGRGQLRLKLRIRCIERDHRLGEVDGGALQRGERLDPIGVTAAGGPNGGLLFKSEGGIGPRLTGIHRHQRRARHTECSPTPPPVTSFALV